MEVTKMTTYTPNYISGGIKDVKTATETRPVQGKIVSNGIRDADSPRGTRPITGNVIAIGIPCNAALRNGWESERLVTIESKAEGVVLAIVGVAMLEMLFGGGNWIGKDITIFV